MSTFDYNIDAKELDIVLYPDPILSSISEEVQNFNGELKDMAENMLLTMYKAPGIGLAAPQVGEKLRFFVLDVDFEREQTTSSNTEKEFELKNLKSQVFINPVITPKSSETIKYQEGCLSLPGIYDNVIRPKEIVVDYFDLNGNKKQMEADGLLSICIQHETDHLDGIMFIDRLSQLKKNFYKKKFLKQKRK